MFSPPPPDTPYDDHPFDWPTLIYQLGRPLTEREVAGLHALLRRRFGERTQVAHEPRRMRLHLRCGAIRNLEDMAKFKRVGDQAAQGLKAKAVRVHPNT